MHPSFITCKYCEQSFRVRPSDVGQRAYCSRECRRKAGEANIPRRFWAKVARSGECWLWQSGGTPDGYGLFTIRSGEQVFAHRLSWELANGPIPEGQWVLHKCDTPGCVNPDHLFLGTHAENMADMHSKGRGRKPGPPKPPPAVDPDRKLGASPLTADDVRAIRERYSRNSVTAEMLAAEFNVAARTIWRVLRRETWGHIQ